MPVVKPPKPIHSITDTRDALLIQIPSPKRFRPIALSVSNLFVLIFGTLLILLGIGINRRDPETVGSTIPVFLFLTLWIGLGTSRLLPLFWDLFGKQVIEISNTSIKLHQYLFFYKRSAHYSAESVQDLRVSTWTKPYDNRVSQPFEFRLEQLANTPLAFDYLGKTIGFGNNIDEAEARQIVTVIVSKFPDLFALALISIQSKSVKYKIQEVDDTLQVIVGGVNRTSWFDKAGAVMMGGLTLVWSALVVGIPIGAISTFFFMNIGPRVAAQWFTGRLTGAELGVVIVFLCAFSPFIVFPMAMAAKMLHRYFWWLRGREIVEITKDYLSIQYRIFGYESPQLYNAAEISSLRAALPNMFARNWFSLLFVPEERMDGVMTFVWNKKTIRFGNRLGELEARHILRVIKHKFPHHEVVLD
jgi:hypothetical protein